MTKNTYWHLTAKDNTSGLLPVIVELTPDGMVYVWPVAAEQGRPLRPADNDQDPDALMIDGDFLMSRGYYHNIADFMDHSEFSAERYCATPIGELESIRICRVVLQK